MKTPIKLEIHGFEASAHIRALIQQNIEKLEMRCGRITSCEVVIRAPSLHHRMGEPYAVSIHMALPGNINVAVGRILKNLDRRHADVRFAISDAFHRAARQLRDKSRMLKGNIKKHNQIPIGKIISVEPKRKCGFLEALDGRQIYFHANSVLGGHFRHLAAGDRVFFHEEVGERGPQASTVRISRASSRRQKSGAGL